jgi:hypothetical protein
MKKYECLFPRCQRKVPCVLISDAESVYAPVRCPHTGEYTGWRIVEEVKEETVTDCNQLPDWCKVEAIGYDSKLHEYFKITQIDNNTVMAKLIESSSYCSYQYFNEFCSEARKRPFNEKEMRGLVGRVVETVDKDALLVTAYSPDRDAVIFDSISHDAANLMHYPYTVDGKPCYVLEHLVDGEWVK